jgi:hypothetical protein
LVKRVEVLVKSLPAEKISAFVLIYNIPVLVAGVWDITARFIINNPIKSSHFFIREVLR